MAGRPKSKVFCQSLRRDGKPCLAKGFLCKNNKYFCRFHGFQNILGFQKPNYTHDTRKKQLRKLKQFKDLTEKAFNTYYEEKLRPRIERQEKIEILLSQLDYSIYRIIKSKSISFERIESIEVHSDIDKCDYIFVPNNKVTAFSNLPK